MSRAENIFDMDKSPFLLFPSVCYMENMLGSILRIVELLTTMMK